MSTVAFLGLGAMGSRIATNLHQAGHTLYVWNRTAGACTPLVQRGAEQCATPREAAAKAEFVVAMLTDDEASRAVWLDGESGAINGLKDGTVAIECSTLSADWCAMLGQKIKAAGLNSWRRL